MYKNHQSIKNNIGDFFMIKKLLKFIITLFLIFFIYSIVTIIYLTNVFENGMLITIDELNSLKSNIISQCTFEQYQQVSNDNFSTIHKGKLNITLFNSINLFSYDINIASDELILCGNTIGVSMNTDGVIVVGFSGVNDNNGIIYPFKNCDLKIGDRIKKLNNIDINTISDIDTSINLPGYSGEPISYMAIRNNDVLNGYVTPVYDTYLKMYKLGLWIREDTSGIGTLTFINPKNNRFASLGHGICENGSDDALVIKSGTIHQCDVLGINKGKKGITGEIKGMFLQNKQCEGVIDKNNKYGVYGYVNQGSKYITSSKIKIGGRLSIKPGKAKIVCCIDGESVKSYNIEIIKTNHQSKSNPKSMVIRIIDKELLEKTGGIIQGMSGSPIIQNGKLVGAVTHVFVNDPTKGFGLYLDWMINQ